MMVELSGVIEDGMPGKNGQRKPGTTRGSPRRSRTAKASHISRHAAKLRCACEWGGWGRLSVDGSGQHNPNPSEGPWGGGLPILRGGASASQRPGSVRDYRFDNVMHEERMQTVRKTVYAGSRLERNIASGRHCLICQPSSRTGENPPYGMIGGLWKRRHHSKPDPRLGPTRLRGVRPATGISTVILGRLATVCCTAILTTASRRPITSKCAYWP
jgi:hypothetical protein